jgi:3'-5' exoribonuclease 1
MECGVDGCWDGFSLVDDFHDVEAAAGNDAHLLQRRSRAIICGGKVVPMKNLLIVDLEATCYAPEDEPPGFLAEIIEIGAVVFDTDARTAICEFQTFVKPVLFPILSAYCTQVTTITQADVNGRLSIAGALRDLPALYDPQRIVFASWGFYDRLQIERECARSGIAYPFGPEHISLKHNHAKFYRLERPLGMGDALRYHSLSLAGRHHRGIDDTRNIARITSCMLADGWKHRYL